ncbi:hypothetical protein AYI70_g11415 [Smittium culicis]|uniref:Uncharacterized protein n=1 Tax=Smittium culicis TaxID=133412 RepID=A0A1R1X227_9FUNG|nr:hypothetical protein AYI70_g11415 [Smittium culicis]
MTSRFLNADKKSDTYKKDILAILEEGKRISSSGDLECNSGDDEINSDRKLVSFTEDSSQGIIQAFDWTNKKIRIDSLIKEHRELASNYQ